MKYFRWKEKYYILTPDYLHCFKKSESKMSDMGSFDYKVTFSLFTQPNLDIRYIFMLLTIVIVFTYRDEILR